jgi:hypothetical protein
MKYGPLGARQAAIDNVANQDVGNGHLVAVADREEATFKQAVDALADVARG